MPTFHFTSPEDDTLVDYFTALPDLQVPFVFLNTNLIPPADLQAGAKLMSKDYFNCFSCHQQGDKQTRRPARRDGRRIWRWRMQRLNPDWILKWLQNPQPMQPGTKMPSFYPGGPDDILNGNEDEQIRAIRDYIFWFGDSSGSGVARASGDGAGESE